MSLVIISDPDAENSQDGDVASEDYGDADDFDGDDAASDPFSDGDDAVDAVNNDAEDDAEGVEEEETEEAVNPSRMAGAKRGRVPADAGKLRALASSVLSSPQ